jgi:hypothetical protein
MLLSATAFQNTTAFVLAAGRSEFRPMSHRGSSAL